LVGIIAAAAFPLLARAQQPRRVWRIGMLETTEAAANRTNVDALRDGLRAHGYVEGQNLAIEYRSADGRGERFANLAAELVRLNLDLIVTRGTPAAFAARNASATIPIVMAASGEPFGTGVVAGLASPGGHVTGLSSFNTELEPKRLELLTEIAPNGSALSTISPIRSFPRAGRCSRHPRVRADWSRNCWMCGPLRTSSLPSPRRCGMASTR